MRTTLTIDDDILAAAKGLAQRQKKSLGEVISALTRQALRPVPLTAELRNGVPLLSRPAGAAPVTPELIQELRDELPC